MRVAAEFALSVKGPHGQAGRIGKGMTFGLSDGVLWDRRSTQGE
jgi:hypothetical protein